jgi:hypothetical protein
VNVLAMSQVSYTILSFCYSCFTIEVQFDMTAWVKRGTREEVGVITDFTDNG